jgi:hypothetical protein
MRIEMVLLLEDEFLLAVGLLQKAHLYFQHGIS